MSNKCVSLTARSYTDHKHYRVSAELLELADVAMQVNLALDSHQADPEVEEELRALLV